MDVWIVGQERVVEMNALHRTPQVMSSEMCRAGGFSSGLPCAICNFIASVDTQLNCKLQRNRLWLSAMP